MKQKTIQCKAYLYIKEDVDPLFNVSASGCLCFSIPLSAYDNISMAFKEYVIFKGVWGSEWSDPIFKWFQKAFQTKDFWNALRNTLMLNGLDLLFGFPLPIILALL